MNITLKKFGVILLTALGSIAAAAIHACIVWPEMAAKTRGLDPQIAELVRTPMIMETSIIFLTTAYYLAKTLARRIGDLRSVALLNAKSSGHLRLVHAVNGVLIVSCRYFLRSYYGAPAWQNGVMICLGLFLIARAIWNSPLRNPEPPE